ncbi:outer membrane beta-barrel protein [Vibrio vulnificus]|uniref:outer membrane beta-barrel protein n=1 Tax=Vibrio vulnificus TaxID=672 RepID=UPI001028B91C|nr:outer membrane beta-barrel protein [Vibrio vulnificus]RZP61098.1 porin family protein [Vibrio vulnificus]
MKYRLLSAMFLLFCNQVIASENGAFYLGAGSGTTKFTMAAEHGDTNVNVDQKTFRVMTGLKFNRVAALEAQYVTYGKPENLAGDVKSYSVMANLGYTFDIGLKPFVNLGVGIAGLSRDRSKETDARPLLRYGFGLDYTPQIIPALTIRLASETDSISMEDDDGTFKANSVYLGLMFNLY